MVAPINQAVKLPLLGLINAATAELGLQQYTQIVGNTDTQALQLLALANREGKDFYQMGIRKEGWEELRSLFEINLIPAFLNYTCTVPALDTEVVNLHDNTGASVNFSTTFISQDVNGNNLYPLAEATNIPSETYVISGNNDIANISKKTLAPSPTPPTIINFYYDRYSLPNDWAYQITQTGWDRSFRWQMLGPLSAQEWQVLKSGISPTGPRRRYRIFGNYLYIDPKPTATENIIFEYYSNAWCQSLSGVARSTWMADTDYYTLDDDCFILGLKWRWLAAKKMDFEQEYESYQRACDRVAARNAAQRDLPLNATASGMRLLNNNNVPDTGYGQ